MKRARSYQCSTHRAPNAASLRGLAQAMTELYGREQLLPPDQFAHELLMLELAPYRKRQGDLVLLLPELPAQ